MRDTIDMAREAGMESNEYMLYEALAHTAWVCDSGDLERFAALVAAAEREACAKVCEQLLERPSGYNGTWEGYGNFKTQMTGQECAAAIRARGNT